MKLKLSLTAITKRLAAKSDEELGAELAQLRDERRAFVREHQGRIRDSAHARIDAVAEEARSKFDSYLAANAGDLVRLAVYGSGSLGLTDLAALWVSGYNEEYRSALHAVVVADTASFSSVSGTDYQERLARFDSDLEERQIELDRRDIVARKESADRETAEALERLVAS